MDIKNSLSKFKSKNVSFSNFKLKLSKKDKQEINKFYELNSKNTIPNGRDFYTIDDDYIDQISEFTSPELCKIIIKNLNEIIKGSNKSNAWICINFNTYRTEYRWHRDGTFYLNPRSKYKFAFTLIGPSTCLLDFDNNKMIIEKYNKLDLLAQDLYKDYNNNKEKILENQRKKNKLFSNYVVVQNNNDTGCVFKVGDEKSAFHSEPLVDIDLKLFRLYISIVTGSKKNIEVIKKHRSR